MNGFHYLLVALLLLVILSLLWEWEAKRHPEVDLATKSPSFVLARAPGGGMRVLDNPHGPITLPCETCHTPAAWTPLREDVRFDHDTQTRFPLTGRHEAASCRSCHFDLVFSEPRLVGDGCANCHVDVHLGQLGPDCSTCHNTTDFSFARVDLVHARTTFPLTGAHNLLSCASCHADAPDGRFAPIDSDCASCHLPDYQRARLDHIAAGFPTTCESCHGTLTWRGARFDHDPFFPIFSGSHAGEWSSCQSCHLQPASFDTFSCTHCHEHRQDRMDDKHDDVSGYVYQSNACLACHPTGEE